MNAAEKTEKKKRDALARQARLAAAEAAKSKRYVLCVNGDSELPVFVDDDVPVGAKINCERKK
jgi:hypothetical protein